MEIRSDRRDAFMTAAEACVCSARSLNDVTCCVFIVSRLMGFHSLTSREVNH